MANDRPRVLITRSPHQASELADRLRALGAEPILIPALEIAAPASFATLDAALAKLDTFHWLLFTSANAVEAFHHRLRRFEESSSHAAANHAAAKGVVILSEAKDLLFASAASEARGTRAGGEPQLPRIAAIGPSTARALEAVGLTPDLIPPQAVAESFTEALLPLSHQPDGGPTRFLLVRAEQAREHLPQRLRAAGAQVTIAPAYRTLIPQDSIPTLRSLLALGADPLDAITFTSSSTVRNLLALCEAAAVAFPRDPLRISIGPITSQTLRDAGLPPDAEAPEATIASLAQTALSTPRLRPSS